MSGPPTEYTKADHAALMAALDEAYSIYDETGPGALGDDPDLARVFGQIEWQGELQGPGGLRQVNLGRGVDLDLARVRTALDKARVAKPAVRYRTNAGWHAQVRALTESKRGYTAADRAGLDASRRTLAGWLSGTVTPSRRNRLKISEAYEELRNWNVNAARKGLADEFSDALQDAYGSDIRIRDIIDMEFE